MPIVKLQNGKFAKFPDTMSPDEITRAIEGQGTQAPPPATQQRQVSPFAGREGYSYKPSGEAISPEVRAAQGQVIAEKQVTPLLQGVGTMVGGMAGGWPAIPLAGLGGAVGKRLGQAIERKPVQAPMEEIKEFGKETAKGALLEGATLGTGKLIGMGANALSKKLYESAVKFSTKLSIPQRTKYVEAGLDKAIFPTEGGLLKMDKAINRVNQQIDTAIKIAGQRGRVSTGIVAKQVDKVKKLYKYDLDLEDEIIPALDELKEKLLKKGLSLSAEEAQGMKVALYRKLRGKYGEMKDFAIEGRKGLARGLMKEIEKLYPEIKGLNKQHATYRGLEEQIERAASRIRNRELISLLATTGGAIGTGMTSDPKGIMAGLAIQMLVSPRTKVGMGIALNRALKAGKGLTAARRLILPGLVLGEEKEEPLKESIGSQVGRY